MTKTTTKATTKATTKTLLLDMGIKLFAECGYNYTGIESILRAADVPKGSFYHFFKSKEDFGIQVIKRLAAQYDARLVTTLNDTSLAPIERIRSYFRQGCQEFEQHNAQIGCLISNLGQEMADQNEAIRTLIQEIFTSWQTHLAKCLRAAQELGEVPLDLDTTELASYCLAGYQGALLQAKVAKNSQPVEIFLSYTFEYLLR